LSGAKNWHRLPTLSKQSNYDFFFDPEFYQADIETRLVFIYILCAASKKMKSGSCKINPQMISDQTKISKKSVENAIKSLISMGCVEKTGSNVISTRSDSINNIADTCSTDRQTDVHTHTRTGEPVTLEQRAYWEDWVKSYQEVSGRSDGMTQKSKQDIQKLIKQGYTLADCSLVVEFKNKAWGKDPKMAKYIRPATLFSGKFETYLDEAKNCNPNEGEDIKIAAMLKDMFPGVQLEGMP